MVQVPLQIMFRQMEPSIEVETKIRERCHKLEQFAEYITCCRIIIDALSRPQQQDGVYQVSMHLTLLGGELNVRQQPHKDVYVAIRAAFDNTRRQLEEYIRQRRTEQKLQGAVSQGQAS